MKKIIFLLLISSAVYAQQYTAGSFGYDEYQGNFKTSVIIGYEFRGLYAEAEQNTYVTKAETYQFSPFKAEYYARVGYSFRAVFIEIEHLCIHEIDDYIADVNGHTSLTIGFDTRLMRDNAKDKNP